MAFTKRDPGTLFSYFVAIASNTLLSIPSRYQKCQGMINALRRYFLFFFVTTFYAKTF